MNPSYAPTGTVYGVLLNFHAEWEAMRPQMSAPPHNAAPQAPVLYIKPGNIRMEGGTTGSTGPR